MVKKGNYPLYFTNNMYDDTIINECIQSFQNRLYYNILNTRKHIQKNVIQTGKLSDFVIDHKLNISYGLPEFTYSLEIKADVVPYYSEKRFADRYHFDTLLSSLDTLRDGATFCKGYYVFLGEYYVYEVKLAMHRHSCTIFLTEVPTKVLTKYFEENPNGNWYLAMKSQSDFYYGYQNRINLFTGNHVLLTGFSDSHEFPLKHKRNKWNIFVSSHPETPNLMTMSDAIMKKDGTTTYFEVSDAFTQYTKTIPTNMKCFVVNEPEYSGSGIYLANTGVTPIFQIPFQKNPIPVENIIVWKYDKESDRKLHILPSDISLRYPNIYDFTNIIGEGDLYIEWLEPTEDIMQYDSYIEDYISCYGEDFTTMIQTETADPLVQNYLPVFNINITTEDYVQSPLKGDNRAWKLEKLIRILKDNPKRYDELMRKLYTNVKKYANYAYTYETKPYIYERNIMDNNAHCKSQDEVKMRFTEPHTYIKVYNQSCETPPVALYINGELRSITYVMAFGSELYVYFPTRYIANHEDIQLDIMLDNNKEIDRISFTIPYVGGVYAFKDVWKLDTQSVSDLLFYDSNTGRILDPESLDFLLKVTLEEIQYIGEFGTHTISMKHAQEKLYEKNGLLVQPTDYDFIYLKGSNVQIDFDWKDSHKKLNMRDVSVKMNDTRLTNTKIYAATTNFFQYRLFETNDGTKRYFEIKNFKGKQTRDRFRVYVNGKLQSRNTYDVEYPEVYNDTIRIHNIALDIGNLEVIYIGYDEELLYEDTVGSLKKGYDDILFLDFIDLPFHSDICAIFIDGYRIHRDQITVIGQGNMITIKDICHRITNDSIITFLMQQVDSDPYEYESSEAFLSTLVEKDAKLKDYMIDRYGK